MSLGEKAKLLITYDYAYGERGHPAGIPPKADLTFEVRLFPLTMSVITLYTDGPKLGNRLCAVMDVERQKQGTDLCGSGRAPRIARGTITEEKHGTVDIM